MLFVRRFTVTALACALAAAPAVSWGQPPAQNLAKFKQAQATFASQMKTAQAGKGLLPRLSDPATAPVVRAALDSSALSLIDPSDLGEGFGVCEPAAEAAQIYVTYRQPNGSASPATPTAQQIQKNSVLYRDEISLVLAFSIDCLGRLMPPLANFWDSMDKPTQDQRKSGVTLIRSGTIKMYVGGMGMLTEADYTPQNKELVLNALVRNAESYASVMAPADRRQVVTAIDTLGKSAPAGMQPRLGQLRAVFSRTACTGLCAI